ncbi:hypothetical protein [Sphingobacterium hungaricum]|uniref:Uncharacterized protein n=1 Tax=Sphingobacterium hungaricum TaxID=2082723 RepID=A0A928UVA5_9SPHI|nr:hypothetical protein [Sphingobacterium hungaricum]MBE8712533.1 hypothetical protein [Sphingobacterium hungaricum]
MNNYVLIFAFASMFLLAFNVRGQDYGKNVSGVYVKINEQNPKTYIEEDSLFSFKVKYIDNTSVTLEIKNKTNDVVELDLSKSYFIVGGNTTSVLPSGTLQKDINLPVPNQIIGPSANLVINLMSRDYLSLLNPLISNKRASKAYKDGNDYAREILTLSFKNSDNSYQTRAFNIDTYSNHYVENQKRANKKKK